MSKQNAVCIIPARGGSKRIPRKNILPLNGIPLVSYSIRAAIDSGVFAQVVVSTEDEEIKEIALKDGAVVDDRPLHMAGDKITKVQVIKEFLERTNKNENFDVVAALLPTCPFRTEKHIREAFELFRNNKSLPFLVGVTEYEFPIQLALSPIDDNVMSMTFKEGYQTTRSQDIQKRYHPNGAIYIASAKAFMEKGTFFNEQMLAYKMSAISSYDIDYPYQFEIAEIISKNYLHEQFSK